MYILLEPTDRFSIWYVTCWYWATGMILHNIIHTRQGQTVDTYLWIRNSQARTLTPGQQEDSHLSTSHSSGCIKSYCNVVFLSWYCILIYITAFISELFYLFFRLEIAVNRFWLFFFNKNFATNMLKKLRLCKPTT